MSHEEEMTEEQKLVKLDGSELWEIVFGIATDAASEITDEQYSKIAQAINDVFITPPPVPQLRGSQAMLDVAAERRRQVEVEGWSPSHDDQHTDGSMAQAAAAYALKARSDESHKNGKRIRPPYLWPDTWHPSWWKPKDRRRDLVRAAALIIAEIERLDRAAIVATSAEGAE